MRTKYIEYLNRRNGTEPTTLSSDLACIAAVAVLIIAMVVIIWPL